MSESRGSERELSETEELIRLFLQGFAPNASDHKGAAIELSKEIEILVRPVIDKADQRARDAEREQDDIQDELNDLSSINSDLEKDIEDLEKKEEWDKMVSQFWYYCGRY